MAAPAYHGGWHARLPSAMGRGWNPRYEAWAKSNGRTCEEQLEADRASARFSRKEKIDVPPMRNFQLWLSQRWAEWDIEQGRVVGESHSSDDNFVFDGWLMRRAG